ncbi:MULTISPECIES: hypothetical protein [Azospirillum]|nr:MULTISPECIES: hypothetical protein [Azospirillum]MDW7551572.1 hypothetical protein [Azospirillum brasilense]MDW7591007.1 hypothetical protein [Azospirillum brasilense]MDW7632711.1 hypothetical protein [Azospirillum brasilense]MDX5951475.1 hypothetical protein [Azospirillum brasilense]TVZ49098.1 hypothetical protein OH82_05671 [Azospirillum brasilense]
MLSKSDQTELEALKARLEAALAGGDDVLTEAEIDRLGELRARERARILAIAQQRQQREAVRGVDRIKLALQRAQRRA